MNNYMTFSHKISIIAWDFNLIWYERITNLRNQYSVASKKRTFSPCLTSISVYTHHYLLRSLMHLGFPMIFTIISWIGQSRTKSSLVLKNKYWCIISVQQRYPRSANSVKIMKYAVLNGRLKETTSALGRIKEMLWFMMLNTRRRSELSKVIKDVLQLQHGAISYWVLVVRIVWSTIEIWEAQKTTFQSLVPTSKKFVDSNTVPTKLN